MCSTRACWLASPSRVQGALLAPTPRPGSQRAQASVRAGRVGAWARLCPPQPQAGEPRDGCPHHIRAGGPSAVRGGQGDTRPPASPGGGPTAQPSGPARRADESRRPCVSPDLGPICVPPLPAPTTGQQDPNTASPCNWLTLTFCPLVKLEPARQKARRQSRRRPRGPAMAGDGARRPGQSGQPVWGTSSRRQAQGKRAGRLGRAVALKAVRRPRQLTPTGTRQDFLLLSAACRRKGRCWPLTPAWSAWALLRAS